jgi:hypothetical protein
MTASFQAKPFRVDRRADSAERQQVLESGRSGIAPALYDRGMSQIISTQYLTKLCDAREYDGLAWIAAVLCGGDQFRTESPTYGLPMPAFDIVERLSWFAQGTRSGAWTYFEATPPERQRAMLAVLEQDEAHPDFAAQYAFGMNNWRDAPILRPLDKWLDDNDELNNDLIWKIISANRELIQSLTNR